MAYWTARFTGGEATAAEVADGFVAALEGSHYIAVKVGRG